MLSVIWFVVLTCCVFVAYLRQHQSHTGQAETVHGWQPQCELRWRRPCCGQSSWWEAGRLHRAPPLLCQCPFGKTRCKAEEFILQQFCKTTNVGLGNMQSVGRANSNSLGHCVCWEIVLVFHSRVACQRGKQHTVQFCVTDDKAVGWDHNLKTLYADLDTKTVTNCMFPMTITVAGSELTDIMERNVHHELGGPWLPPCSWSCCIWPPATQNHTGDISKVLLS